MTVADFYEAVRVEADGKYFAVRVEASGNRYELGIELSWSAYIDGRGWTGQHRDAHYAIADIKASAVPMTSVKGVDPLPAQGEAS